MLLDGGHLSGFIWVCSLFCRCREVITKQGPEWVCEGSLVSWVLHGWFERERRQESSYVGGPRFRDQPLWLSRGRRASSIQGMDMSLPRTINARKLKVDGTPTLCSRVSRQPYTRKRTESQAFQEIPSKTKEVFGARAPQVRWVDPTPPWSRSDLRGQSSEDVKIPF